MHKLFKRNGFKTMELYPKIPSIYSVMPKCSHPIRIVSLQQFTLLECSSNLQVSISCTKNYSNESLFAYGASNLVDSLAKQKVTFSQILSHPVESSARFQNHQVESSTRFQIESLAKLRRTDSKLPSREFMHLQIPITVSLYTM